ncbi:UbiA family prenyltransferase|uniref:UbiA family prenyltransferase n=1 Tax=Noviherbaspirillum sp. L7-7A TaxID=2850560 RepID=UPI001C2CBC90|nr:UbiA family prenyltransferase [Noviherbaspirillum sp. L7-7A]MBV0881055.1 UbiA family prenyltransferase [Noviherbaspirillum sp. L7-7A]
MNKISLAEVALSIPLVVDLDGTLTPTDTLVESIFSLLKKNPLNIFVVLLWLFTGRAEFKRRVACRTNFSIKTIPWREDFLTWLREQHNNGRTLVLATAAHRTIAQDAAHHLGFFHKVISTDSGSNLKGTAKLQEIQKQIGSRFSYAGDSSADLPIWRAAETAVLVGASQAISREVRESGKVEIEFHNRKAGVVIWLRALRVHQWLKNLLLFIPILASFAFDDALKISAALIAFASFSFAASATYIFNDLWDLESDRKHPRKRYRPFASAHVPIFQGVIVAGGLFLTSLVLACFVSYAFASMVVGYIVLTTLYSWTLKHYVLIDVLMLAVLYTFRVLAGSIATEIHITQWLLAFSIFMFFGLALIKRCAELKSLQMAQKKNTEGRDYQVEDLAVLWPLGIAASLCSVVVFGLYIGAPQTKSAYANADLLWLVGLGLLYWNARLWIKTARGEMHDDPIVFAARDFGSQATLLMMIGLTLLARLLG